MASRERTEQLKSLIEKAGGYRKAQQYIELVKGVSPTHSALYKAAQGSTTDYIVQSYIDDLNAAITQYSKPQQ